MTDQERLKNYNTSAAIDKGEEKVRDTLHEVEKRLKEGRQQITQWAKDVDKKAHENPWPLVAGVGLASFLFGLLIGKSKN